MSERFLSFFDILESKTPQRSLSSRLKSQNRGNDVLILKDPYSSNSSILGLSPTWIKYLLILLVFALGSSVFTVLYQRFVIPVLEWFGEIQGKLESFDQKMTDLKNVLSKFEEKDQNEKNTIKSIVSLFFCFVFKIIDF